MNQTEITRAIHIMTSRKHDMSADVSLEGKVDPRSAASSSSLLKLDNRKVFSATMVADHETETDGLIATGFKPGGLFFDPEIDVHGNASTQPLMGSVLVVPVHEERQFLTHGLWVERDEDAAGAFMFHGADDTFDHGDAAVLTDEEASDN